MAETGEHLILASASPIRARLLLAAGLEGSGIQLFADIKGDYFGIFGQPLLELLGFLPDRGALPS